MDALLCLSAAAVRNAMGEFRGLILWLAVGLWPKAGNVLAAAIWKEDSAGRNAVSVAFIVCWPSMEGVLECSLGMLFML